ncbi:MAG: acyltransferase [Limnohabitans sp.]|jgi:acetyltransferase-like isoleucine patch superfamily enzyme|uniref:acyltransferase n=1 Tax=Limnohabitans sp. TaxID=1907725 RepID=UPI00391AE629
MLSLIKRVILDIVESSIRNISGGVGRRIRYAYYKKRFARCGENVIIDIGVIFENPGSMEFGNNVWINSYTQLVAGVPGNTERRIMKIVVNADYTGADGHLYIGSGVGIGSYNILHAFGGLYIGNNVTTSAGVRVYSFSHYYRDDANPSRVTYANCMVESDAVSCIVSPIVIGDGVWLGTNTAVFGGTLGENAFVAANSVVIDDLPPNSYAQGQPAKRIKNRFAEMSLAPQNGSNAL